MIKTATISPCGKFRYLLGRNWGADSGKPLLFVMLNPSTADAEQDNATIRRCIRFARDHGYTAIEVVNLFAYRATKPADLKLAGYPVGEENDRCIAHSVKTAAAVCVAWGANASGLERPQVVLPLIRSMGVEPQCLSITKGGYPGHPLMLAATCRLHPFTAQAISEAMQGAKA